MTIQIQPIIAQAISRDFTSHQIANFSTEEKTNIVLAYTQAEFKKMEQFQSMYLTNPQFKSEFKNLVHGMVA